MFLCTYSAAPHTHKQRSVEPHLQLVWVIRCQIQNHILSPLPPTIGERRRCLFISLHFLRFPPPPSPPPEAPFPLVFVCSQSPWQTFAEGSSGRRRGTKTRSSLHVSSNAADSALTRGALEKPPPQHSTSPPGRGDAFRTNCVWEGVRDIRESPSGRPALVAVFFKGWLGLPAVLGHYPNGVPWMLKSL